MHSILTSDFDGVDGVLEATGDCVISDTLGVGVGDTRGDGTSSFDEYMTEK
jgi:hypothetical protein